MIAAVLRGVRTIEIEEWSVPEITADEALVRVRGAAICGSDLHGFKGLIPQRRPPGLIMGHEGAGEVVRIGEKVTTVSVGDRVAIDPQISCGVCPYCQRGWPHLCANLRTIGSAMHAFRHGTNAEYLAMPAASLYPLPDDLSFAEGAMAEPVGTAVHLAGRAGIGPGSTVVVIGAGTQGLIALQAARALGADKIWVSELSRAKLSLAEQLGADVTISPHNADPVDVIMEDTAGYGVDVVLECVGLEATYQQAIRMLRKRGVIGALGYLDELVAFQMRPLLFRELSVIGSTGFYWPEDHTLEMMADGRIVVEPLITHRIPLIEAQRGYELAEDPDAIKVVLVSGPDGSNE